MSGFDNVEWEELKDLKGSHGWRCFRNLVILHRQFLMDKAHQYLKLHEDRKAGEFLAKAEETARIMNLVSDRLKELETLKEKQ